MIDEHNLGNMISNIEEAQKNQNNHGGIFVSCLASFEILKYLKELQRIIKEEEK